MGNNGAPWSGGTTITMHLPRLGSFIGAALLSACAATGAPHGAASAPAPAPVPPAPAPPPQAQSFYPSTYQVPTSAPVLIRDATVLTGLGTRLEHSDVLLADGKIQAVGTALTAPAGARIIDGAGRWVTPGSSTSTRISACIRARRWRETPTATRRPHPAPPTCGPSTRCGRRIRAFARRSPAASRRCRSCRDRPISSAGARWC